MIDVIFPRDLNAIFLLNTCFIDSKVSISLLKNIHASKLEHFGGFEFSAFWS